MASVATLATTTLTQQVSASDTLWKVASTSGWFPGTRLFLDRELASVISIIDSLSVNVARGVDGSASSAHAYASVITSGRPDQFYSSDPVGLPPNEPAALPYINVLTGVIWVAVGDDAGPQVGARFWQAQTTSQYIGSLGVRVTPAAAPVGG